MAADDLSSISGMEEKHRKALGRRDITTLGGLADADPQVIYRAMGSLKPRPDLDQIARWQDEARARLGGVRDTGQAPGRDQAPGRTGGTPGRPDEGAIRAAEWQPVASFAVVFARRWAGGTWERRIEAERTEVEPEREPEVWPGWECTPVCGWMTGQLTQAGSGPPGGPGPDGSGHAQPAGEDAGGRILPAGQRAGAARPRGERPQLRIDSAEITDAAGRAGLVAGGVVAAGPPAELAGPARVVFTVSGARRGTQVEAVARLRGHGEPGRNVADPVTVPPSGRAEFDLSRIPPGPLEMGLLAWAPDGTARPVSVSLPVMRISPRPGRH